MVRAIFFLKNFLSFFLFIIACYSCKPIYDLRHLDLAAQYNPIQTLLFAHTAVFPVSADSVTLVIDVPAAQNNFQLKKLTFVASLKFYAGIQNLYAKDSSEKTISISPSFLSYHFEIPISLKSGENEIIHFTLVETSSLKSIQKIIPVENSYGSLPEIYPLIAGTNEKYILPYANENTIFQFRNQTGTDTFRISFYKFSFHLAAPTFFSYQPQQFPEKVDTVYVITSNENFNLSNEGLYWIVSSKNPSQNFCLLGVRNDFPSVSSLENLAKCLRYITKNDEYDYINEKNLKERVDSFWLEKSGTMDHAKDMIRRYYTRVQFANEFFTTYQEGWQTDKGLVYIIYGPPDEVYFDRDAEWWGYRSRGNRSALRFKFVREENPYHADSWILMRNPNYFDSWNRQGYAWRHGLAD